MKRRSILLLVWLIALAYSAKYNYTECDFNNKNIFNSKSLTCSACPNSLLSSVHSYSPFPTSCSCNPATTFVNYNSVCTVFVSASSICNSSLNQIKDLYNREGLFTDASGCPVCDTKSRPNADLTKCIPCPIGATSTNGTCLCLPGQFMTDYKCTTTNLYNLKYSASINQKKMYHAAQGCYSFSDQLSCSYLINVCTFSMADSTVPECNFFDSLNSSLLKYQNNSSFRLTSGDFKKGSSLKFKLFKFEQQGNLIKETNLSLPQIFRCGIGMNSSMDVIIGSNVDISCTFDFNNLVAKMMSKQSQSYTYQLLVQGIGGQYFQVPVYFNGDSTKGFNRFFLENSFTDPTRLTVVSEMQFILTLNTNGQLVSPSLKIKYVNLALEAGIGVTPVKDQIQSISYKVSFTYDLTNFWTVAISIFCVVSGLALVHTIFSTYVGYLNRKNPLLFFLNFLRIWSLWIFYFMLVISGYWFLFTKATPDIFIFMPTNDPNGVAFYIAFYVVAGIMGLFRIVTTVISKVQKLSTEVFLINWERGANRNSWRQIFIINSLAQFYTYRTISFFWMLLVLMFFLVGLDWQDHAAQSITTSLSDIQYFNPRNRVLLYFLGSSIFLVIGIIFKIIRRIAVIQIPYPFQDFVDYCSVANISFFFIKKRSPMAFYIHASLPQRMEGNYKQINEAINRNLQKNRTIARQISQLGGLRLYLVYLSTQLETSFNNMLRKSQEYDHGKRTKYASDSKKNKKQNFRQQFIETKLKIKLQDIARNGSNHTKNVMESLLGFPPIDLRDQNILKKEHVLYDQNVQLVNQVFPNGNQFEDLHTIIIIFLLWNLLLNNTPAAAFLTYIIDEFIMNGYISMRCRSNLEAMTRVKQGFML